ncbi:methyltransferase domain-containing protein [Thalassotalea maritima]|uniref:methyltransferase domain-containing protein n=1 Tax=Thalassotalea maritima TaxID=3242416 RepID=UPI0035275BFB
MKPALAFAQLKKPKTWQDMSSGLLIKKHIEKSLEPWWQRAFGYHMLKLGQLSSQIESQQAKIPHQINVCESPLVADVVAEIDDLPFVQQSIDLCLLTLQLEYAVDPHHILREADRVLIANGYMVIAGINPWSLAGVNKLIPYRRQQLPWQGRFFTPMRVKDWLNLLGYEIVDDQRILFSGLHNKQRDDRWWFKKLQTIGQSYLPLFCSVYVIVAKKRVQPLTPIRPKWQLRHKFRPINVSTIGQNRHI